MTTSPVNKALDIMATLIYSDAFKSFFEYAEKREDKRLPVPVHIICDDFATGSRIPRFDEQISIFCAKGISVTLLLQSESQLENMYGKTGATTIINNCDTYVYMGGMDDQTCDNVARRWNKPRSTVSSLPLEQLIVFRRGSKPVVTTRYKTYEDPVYKELVAQDAKKKARQRV